MRILSTLYVSLIILSSCGGTGIPEFNCDETLYSAGLTFCMEDNAPPTTAALVADIVDLVEVETQKTYPQVRDIAATFAQMGVLVAAVDNTRFMINCRQVRGSYVYMCDSGLGGYTVPNIGFIMLHAQSNGCYADAVLAHELLHIIDVHYLRSIGRYHDREGMFGNCVEGTIENRMVAGRQIIRDRYPELCSAGL